MRAYKDVDAGNENDPGLCLTKNYRGRVYRLRWSDVNRIRLTGPTTPDMKNILPYRFGPDENNFSQFLLRIGIFRGGTTRRVTFFTPVQNPDNPSDYLDPEVHQPPICRFYEKVRQKAYSDPALEAALMRGGNNRGPALPNPNKIHALGQGIVLRQDRNNVSRIVPMFPCIVVFPPSARTGLEALLNAEIKGYTGDPNDYANRFVAGRLLDPDAGTLLRVYNPKNAPASAAPAQIDWNQAQRGQGASGQMEVSHYTVEIGEPLALPRLPDGRLKMAAEGTLFTPWDDCLRLLTEREQFDMVVGAFEDYPQLLCQIFSDRREWLPESVKRQAAEMGMQAQSLAVPPTYQGAQVPYTIQPSQAAGVPQGGNQQPPPSVAPPQASIGGIPIDWESGNSHPGPDAQSSGVTSQMSPEAFAQASTQMQHVAAPQIPQVPTQGMPVQAPYVATAPTAPAVGGRPQQQIDPRVAEAMRKLDEVKAQQAAAAQGQPAQR